MRSTREYTSGNADIAAKGIMSAFAQTFRRKKLGELLVHSGYISPFELKDALHTQKETNRPLGQIILETTLITRRQLYTLLAWQSTTRMTAAVLVCFLSLSGMSKKARAGQIEDLPQQVSLALNSSTDAQNLTQISAYPALFGANEKFSPNLKAFTKWTSMFERFNDSMNSQSSRKIIEDLKHEIASFKSDSVAQMAKDVNDMMNKKKYIIDNKNWGKSDYWATPIEFMTRGGDCEDFAIAKYTALRALGVPESRLRIAIVHDQKKNIPHAILIVYSEKGALILDNQIDDAREANRIHHYKPIFSINRDGWWLHTTPKGDENTVVASAR